MQAKSTPIRILVVEDHGIMREGLTMILNSQQDMAVIGEAADGAEAVSMYRRLQPDITLLDLRLPTMQGVEVIREVRRDCPNARFIVLTTYEGDEDVHSAIQAGAQAYLLKGMSREDLLEAIRIVHEGLRRIPAAVALRLAEHMDHVDLSVRELEVLRRIAGGYSNKEIAYLLNITEFTVKFHVKAILGKLGARDRTHAVTTAIQRGIIHLP